MKKEECRHVLDESSTFSQLGTELTNIVFDAMTLEHHPPGSHLIRQGDPGERLLVLVRGHAVARLRDNGMGHDLGEFFPGDVFGEIALLTKEARSADVVLDQDGWVLSLDAAEFDKLAMMHPEVAVVLTHLTADRLGRYEHDGLGGKSVGGYRIRRCIGRGAMAVVYEAESDQDARRYALKMMSHRLIYETTASQRFQREGELLLELNHPHIAVVHDRFRAYRTYFLAMEYCGGGSLEALMRAHDSLTLATVRGIAGQLAQALGYLHGQGVLHRDVKPANILFDEAGNLKLADFGLARPSVSMNDGLTTDSAVVVGTPLYLAPELFSGAKPGPASDLYSLGCILFELLHKRLPFDATDLGRMIETKRRGTPPFDPALDEEMRSILAALLSPKPARRVVDLRVLESWAAPVDGALLVRV